MKLRNELDDGLLGLISHAEEISARVNLTRTPSRESGA